MNEQQLIDWLREYTALWERYHRERLKREAFDRWLFWAIGLLMGLAIGVIIKP